jgi:hypothetical protein
MKGYAVIETLLITFPAVEWTYLQLANRAAVSKPQVSAIVEMMLECGRCSVYRQTYNNSYAAGRLVVRGSPRKPQTRVCEKSGQTAKKIAKSALTNHVQKSL